MIVATPGDPVEAKAIASISANYDGPMYIRLGKAGEKIVHNNKINLHIGDILPLKENSNNTAVLCCGSILDIARQQIENENLPYDLYSIPFVKPINNSLLLNIIESHPSGLIVMEEHQASCGVGSAIIEQASDMYSQGILSNFPKIIRKAIKDEFVGVVGNQNYLRKITGLQL